MVYLIFKTLKKSGEKLFTETRHNPSSITDFKCIKIKNTKIGTTIYSNYCVFLTIYISSIAGDAKSS